MKELRLLKIIINNHPLIADNTEFSLLPKQDTAIIAGMNATGKTTIMKSIIGILELLLKNLSINQTRLNEILIGEEPINFQVYLCGTDSKIYLDDITLSRDSGNDWFVFDETISVTNDLNNFTQIYKRSELEKDILYLLAKDDSMFRMLIAKEEYKPQQIFDTFINSNKLFYTEKEVSSELLNYLDSTIEYLKFNQTETGNVIYRLKFKNNNKEITDIDFETIKLYLSSGTIKVITLYQQILNTLKTGGIIFVDGIERHLNQTILRTLIELFADEEININHACLVYSTHYTEILNEVQGDQLFITRRNEKIELIKYSNKNIKNNLSKTDIFESDYLNGTAPSYDSYMSLKRYTKSKI